MNIDLNKALSKIDITYSFSERKYHKFTYVNFLHEIYVEELDSKTFLNFGTENISCSFADINDPILSPQGNIITKVNKFSGHCVYLNGVEYFCPKMYNFDEHNRAKIDSMIKDILIEKTKQVISNSIDEITFAYNSYIRSYISNHVINLLKDKGIEYNDFQNIKDDIDKALLLSVLE